MERLAMDTPDVVLCEWRRGENPVKPALGNSGERSAICTSAVTPR